MQTRSFTLAAFLLFTSMSSLTAQEARFFRVAGPVPVTITALSADGYVTWTNEATNATFTVQTATSLIGPSNWVDWVQVPATNAATTNRLFDFNPPGGMALIPAGSFTMGDTLDGSSFALPLHTLQVSAFYLDQVEVAKALWDEVRVWANTNGYDLGTIGSGPAPNDPVHSVIWYAAVKWCNARSEKEGRVPAYYTEAEQTVVYRTGTTNVQNGWVKWSRGYRLPTEAEWEKAARGGASGQRFPWGNNITHSRANYYSSASYAYDTSPTRGYHPDFRAGVPTNPGGYFAANGYGLYDLAGSLWEWTWDWSAVYTGSPETDPRGPTSGSYRAIRGGSWSDPANNCRAAFRGSIWPDYADGGVGFRSVLPSGQ